MKTFIWNSYSFFCRILFFSISFLLSSTVFARTGANDSIEIIGHVVGLTEPICEYRLSISTSRGDSIPSNLLFSKTFKQKRFHIKLRQVEAPLTLNIHAIGYKIKNKNLGVVNSRCDIGTLELTKDDAVQDLPTVVVTATKHLLVEQGMKSKYNIAGSMLSEAGSLMSLFRRLPNLSVNNGKLTVLDSYGIETIVLLNDREVRDNNILEVLNAKDVKSIEIDRSPGILYQGKIVIKIETVKKINDYIYTDVDLTYTQGRRPYGNIGTNVRGKFGSLSMGVSYRYNYNNLIIDDENFREIPSNSVDLSLIDNTQTKETERKHNILVNLEYMPNEKTNWSLLYNSIFTQQKSNLDTDREMRTAMGVENTRIGQNSPTSMGSHSLSLGLNKVVGGGKVTLLADYALTDNTTEFSTTEQKLATRSTSEVVTKMNSNAHLGNILAKYNFVGPFGITLNLGLKSNVAIIPTNYHFTTREVSFPTVQDVNTLEHSDILFLDTEKWITKRFQLQTGVSYDFTYQHIKYQESGVAQSIHKQYHNIIPSLSAVYLLGSRSFLALGLSVPFIKPRFEDIAPSAIYKDALLYEQREPNVKATRTYLFSGMWRYNSFFVRALISHSPLFYEHTYERLSPSSLAMKSVIAPFRNQTFSQITMNYTKQWNNGFLIQANGHFYLRPNFINGEVAKHHFTYFPILTIGYNKPTVYAWVALSYLNETSNGIQWVDRTGFNVDAGATINLLKGRLTIEATAPNLTRINVPAQYSINGGIKWGIRPIDRDCEFFNISVRYKLFNKDIRLQQQRGNSEELNRILK